MNQYISKETIRSEKIAVDGEAVISELSKGNFYKSTNKGSYAAEKMTSTYNNSILEALDELERKYEELNQEAKSFITEFQNVPEPATVESDTSYLDQ